MNKIKIIRITTVPQSLAGLLTGQLAFMNRYFEVIGISSPGNQLQEITKEEGIDTYGVEMSRRITPIKDLLALWKLYKILKKEKPTIVHTHTPKAGTLGMLAAYLAKIPFRLHTVAGLPLMEARGFKRRILNFVEKVTYRCATGIYPNSKGLESFILNEDFCNQTKVKVIGKGSSNGINTIFFSEEAVELGFPSILRQKYKINQEHTVFCFIGRMVGDKGINELVKAFCKLYEIDQSSRLLLVGPFEKELDPLLAKTEKIIEEHPGIIWEGWQDDVRPFLAISDVFTFPSYREGFPNVIMQAGAMGLPCIVTDINGCNEIIEDGLNGLIIPPKNDEALYNAMKDLLINSDKRNKLTLRARQIIINRYERQFIWNELLKEYENVLSNKEQTVITAN
jgi:glycosyltransferase involved in cell wall biosynthesis